MQNRPQDTTIEMQSVSAEKARFKLPRDPNKAMQEVMFTIERLGNALAEETAALKNTDTQTFLRLQDQKVDIARDYLEGMSQLIARKEELKTADENIKNRLEKMRDDFAHIAHDNHAALNRMKNGMKRLGDRIMEAARDTARKQKQFSYGANGVLQSSTNGTIGVSESA